MDNDRLPAIPEPEPEVLKPDLLIKDGRRIRLDVEDPPDYIFVFQVDASKFEEEVQRSIDRLDALKYAMETRVGFQVINNKNKPFWKMQGGGS